MPKDRKPDKRVVAFRDTEFLNSPEARPLRILAEYIEPLKHFRQEQVRDTIVFFGSARITEEGPMGRYYHEARELARRLTHWSDSLENSSRRFVVCSGGGPGIMEAANRGAADAGGKSIGLNIGLPMEQFPNPYITPSLNFEFHYFFMRKFWFAYPGKAFVMFPGGFGTFDELMEILTLAQTRKLQKKIIIVLYGKEFWTDVIELEKLARLGMISPEDLKLFEYADEVETAFRIVTDGLVEHHLQTRPETPDLAKSLDPNARDRL